MEETEEINRVERIRAKDGGIATYCDCPYRIERILTYKEVVSGTDYITGLCPNRCPSSPRNADYSICNHPSLPRDVFAIRTPCVIGCRVGVTEEEAMRHPVSIRWCEASVVGGKCPLQFTR